MTLAVCCMWHTPLLELTDPGPDKTADVETAFAAARDFVRDDPELVILFAPDHCNGFFHGLMPPCCVGLEATSIGDYGSEAGPLDVPRDIALACATSAFDDGARRHGCSSSDPLPSEAAPAGLTVAITMVDGYETLVMAFVAPVPSGEWGIGPVRVGYLPLCTARAACVSVVSPSRLAAERRRAS
jgi:hypothetical protein